jgi:hypothetical protein
MVSMRVRGEDLREMQSGRDLLFASIRLETTPGHREILKGVRLKSWQHENRGRFP